MPRIVGSWLGGLLRRGSSGFAVLLLALAALSPVGDASAADPGQRLRITVGSELDYPPFALVTKDG